MEDPPPSYSATNSPNERSTNYYLLGTEGKETEDSEDISTCDIEGGYVLMSTNEYDEAYKKLNKDYDHDYEEPFWEPATQEEELREQLARLGVAEIAEDKLK